MELGKLLWDAILGSNFEQQLWGITVGSNFAALKVALTDNYFENGNFGNSFRKQLWKSLSQSTLGGKLSSCSEQSSFEAEQH